MTRLLLMIGAAAMAISAPALAQQHHGHHMPAPTKPAVKKAVAKKVGAKKASAKKAPARKPSTKTIVGPKPTTPDPHAGHQMPAATSADPHVGHQMLGTNEPHAAQDMPAPADSHAGHAMPAQADPHAEHDKPAPADPHAGHDMTQTAAAPPIAPPPPAAFSGVEHAADAIYGNRSMATSRRELRRMHGKGTAYRLLVDRLEARVQDGRNGYALEGEAWYGGDIDKLWLKADGHGEFGASFETMELQALWSYAIGPWFDAQAGVRYDFARGPDRAHLALAVQGLAPYWIEVEAAAFLSDKGAVTATIEAEHDTRITQKLILQPRTELALSLQDEPRIRVGSGLTEAIFGLRLRYELVPELAPYVGLEWSRAFGRTARMRRADGEDAGSVGLVAGLRFWF